MVSCGLIHDERLLGYDVYVPWFAGFSEIVNEKFAPLSDENEKCCLMEPYGLVNLKIYITVRGTVECSEYRNTAKKLTNTT